MHNLQSVAFAERSFGPAVANRNCAIEFDGDAIAFKLQVLYELRQGSAVRTLLRLAIDDHSHNSSVAERKKAFEIRRPGERPL